MVGAITGQNSYGEIKYCFAFATVNGDYYIGGLVGINKAPIENSYAICEVNGQQYVGGLVGNNANNISCCYSASTVDGGDYTGVFVGYNAHISQYSKCFWDTDLNPGLSGMTGNSDPNVIGLPTAELQKRATFVDAGWDMINIWDIGENQTYPFLRTHLPSDINKDGETNLYDFAILAQNWLAEE